MKEDLNGWVNLHVSIATREGVITGILKTLGESSLGLSRQMYMWSTNAGVKTARCMADGVQSVDYMQPYKDIEGVELINRTGVA